jgi:glycosyltransferase involved in cell wall biosynthesis
MAELEGFRRRQCDVWLIAPEGSAVAKRAATAGIDTVPLRTTRTGFLFETIRIARWLRHHRVEVVNTHSSRDGWLVGIAARLARSPSIVRTRHIDVDYPNRWISRHAFTTFADHVFTTSRKITSHFQEIFRIPDHRISTIPTGIDLELFSPPNTNPANAPGSPVVGMVSVLRSWKGHSTFLDAAQRLVAGGFNGRFAIVGEGPMRSSIEASIRELNLSSRVTLTGHREDVPEVLHGMDVLVIASTKHEGVPQIGLQALATRTPVVGSDVGGTPEIIRDGETGRVFPAGDAAALAQAILDTLRDSGTRALTARGRKLVEAGHSLESMLDAIETVYNRLVPR